MKRQTRTRTFLLLLLLVGLGTSAMVFLRSRPESRVMVAHLGAGDAAGFAALREAFIARNPGYDLQYHEQVRELPTADYSRVALVQEGTAGARISGGSASEIAVGDIVLLRPGEGLQADSLLSLLEFRVPDVPPDSLPPFIRTDWDPRITDTPGGCATETGAYRRILLTWKQSVGPYVFHALNAHRVRITDSFTHYHPEEGGFDEFYLVQMVQPGAKLITSDHVERIVAPETIERGETPELLDEHPLSVGDLVYMPRGIVHRGVGGVLAQVITVPGFIPGAEIGVDHHLRAVNERLQLQGADSLPYNQEASTGPVVR